MGKWNLLFFWKVPVLWGKLNIDFLTVGGLWVDLAEREYTVTPLCGCHKEAGQKIYKYRAKDASFLSVEWGPLWIIIWPIKILPESQATKDQKESYILDKRRKCVLCFFFIINLHFDCWTTVTHKWLFKKMNALYMRLMFKWWFYMRVQHWFVHSVCVSVWPQK